MLCDPCFCLFASFTAQRYKKNLTYTSKSAGKPQNIVILSSKMDFLAENRSEKSASDVEIIDGERAANGIACNTKKKYSELKLGAQNKISPSGQLIRLIV